MKRIVLENLRSAYNVGNIVRTADALAWGVVRVGYTARWNHKQVIKTSLGSEQAIPKMEFETIQEFLDYTTTKNITVIAAELTETSVSLGSFDYSHEEDFYHKDIAIVVGNEVTGVEQETLEQSDAIVHIPMQGIKESLNVGQAAAIMMRELGKHHHI